MHRGAVVLLSLHRKLSLWYNVSQMNHRTDDRNRQPLPPLVSSRKYCVGLHSAAPQSRKSVTLVKSISCGRRKLLAICACLQTERRRPANIPRRKFCLTLVLCSAAVLLRSNRGTSADLVCLFCQAGSTKSRHDFPSPGTNRHSRPCSKENQCYSHHQCQAFVSRSRCDKRSHNMRAAELILFSKLTDNRCAFFRLHDQLSLLTPFHSFLSNVYLNPAL